MKTPLDTVQWNGEQLTKGQRMTVGSMRKALDAVCYQPTPGDISNVVFKRIFVAFQEVGDVQRFQLSKADRLKVTETYVMLRSLLKGDSDSIGAEMFKRGLSSHPYYQPDWESRPRDAQELLNLGIPVERRNHFLTVNET